MKTMNLKKAAALMALVELLSGSTAIAKADNSVGRIYYILTQKGTAEIVDDPYVIINHQKTKMEEGDTISIFNEKNLFSLQYGGNQRDFIWNYPSLMKDPYIMDELHRLFPEEDFASPEMANDFYISYLDAIGQCGCGYVAVANKVFKAFEGKEQEFEKIFGYPMYTLDDERAIDYNYEYFIFDFANFSLMYPNYNAERREAIKGMFAKTLARKEWERYYRSEEYINRPKLDHNMTVEEAQRASAINGKYYDLRDAYQKATDEKFSLGIKMESHFGHVVAFLQSFGLKAKLKVVEIAKGTGKPGDILASNQFDLYKEDGEERYSEKNDVDPHSVYVVDVVDGKTYVSSWGEKFIFDDSAANWTVKVDLEIKPKGK